MPSHQIASVIPLSPAKPLCWPVVVLVRNLEQHLLVPFVRHLLGVGAGFFCSPPPILGIVQMRCNGHGPFSYAQGPKTR